jgi:tetratricopeptide (TPR) repeat protein
MARNSKPAEGVSRFKKASAAVGVIGAVIGVILGGGQIVSHVREARQAREEIEIHLAAGDRFAGQDQYAEANKEFEKVLQIDKSNVDARRRLVRVARQRLTFEAFPPGNQGLDIGLRRDYPTSFADAFETVSDDEINAALTHLYELQSLDPQLKDDVDLKLDEALILKTNGKRLGDAIKALERAHELAPENPDANAELGLMLAVPEESHRKVEGVALVRRAVQNHPDEARYHFYLARSLEEVYACPYVGIDSHDSNGPQGCAEAIREYHRSADLATGGDTWSPAIRVWAHRRAMDIFHRYARKEDDILTPNLAMPLGERLKELEYLIPTGASTSQVGSEDDPNFWIPQLEFAMANTDQADQHLRDLMQKDHDRWLGTHEKYWEDAYYLRNRVPYAQMFVKVLEKTGRDPQALAKVQSILRLPAKP